MWRMQAVDLELELVLLNLYFMLLQAQVSSSLLLTIFLVSPTSPLQSYHKYP